MDVSLTFDPPFNGMTWDMEFFIGKPQNGFIQDFLISFMYTASLFLIMKTGTSLHAPYSTLYGIAV